MKTTGIIALMLCFLQGVNAQQRENMKTNEPEKAAIEQALEQYYFKGLYEGDTSLLKQVFHPDALLFGDINGQPYAKAVSQYLDGVAGRVSPKDSGQPFTAEILSVDVMNSIAIAKLHVKMYTFNYYNFLTLHQMDGKWLIVNKTLTNVGE